MRSRDSNRLSDLATLNEALNLYTEDVTSASLGNASTTYLSIPDPVATSTAGDQCQGLGLPSLPSGYSYQCAASSTCRLTNGTGWLPVNFTAISVGSPFGSLPTDPTNQTISGLYYAYLPGSGNTWELISKMESQKYQASSSAAGSDGGYNTAYYEAGTNLNLALNMPQTLDRVTSTDYLAFDTGGLVGYWPLNEGQGTTAVDQSGNGNNGTWSGTQSGTNGYYSVGGVGNWAGAFNGTNDKVTFNSSYALSGPLTYSAWLYSASTTAARMWLGDNTSGGVTIGVNAGYLFARLYANGSTLSSVAFAPTGTWFLMTVTRSSSGTFLMYLNGISVQIAFNNSSTSDPIYIGANNIDVQYWLGSVDDVRIYNRILSAQEIQAMYTGGL